MSNQLRLRFYRRMNAGMIIAIRNENDYQRYLALFHEFRQEYQTLERAITLHLIQFHHFLSEEEAEGKKKSPMTPASIARKDRQKVRLCSFIDSENFLKLRLLSTGTE